MQIQDFDHMKMLKELFAKAQSCPELNCDTDMGDNNNIRDNSTSDDVGK